jgi:hypothetical protein
VAAPAALQGENAAHEPTIIVKFSNPERVLVDIQSNIAFPSIADRCAVCKCDLIA